MKKILIAEDDEAILEVLTTILEGEGHTIFSSKTAREIHDIAKHEKPNFILLDIWLDGHDGEIIARELKAKDATKNIPIIIMSANNQTEKIAQSAGVDGFLLKPFTIDELLTVVRKYTS